jgi:hemin uptake protein HemP
MKKSDAPERLAAEHPARLGVAAAPLPALPRSLDARVLMEGAREIILTLDGEPYRLRITARQKLILTK